MFPVEIEETASVLGLKEKIASDKADFEVERQKLIHAGKVLKDTATIGELGIKETEFIVCMVSAKPKQSQTPPPPPSTPPVLSTPIAQPITHSTPQAPVSSAPLAGATISTPANAVSTPNAYEDPSAVAALTAMGFPEAECRAALRAAMGNGDVAVEFLMNGIPESAQMMSQGEQPSRSAAPAQSSLAMLEDFRRHPNFTQLQRLVQENPAELNRVLGVIGNQNPALLAAIHENHDAFIAMMNEPIGSQPASSHSNAAPSTSSVGGSSFPGFGPGGISGSQMVQMMQAMPPAQRAMMAQSMGISPEQLNAVMQMMAATPPEQIQQLMQSMGGMGGMGGMPGGGGVPGGQGGVPTGAHVVRLTEDEMAAVNRLMELGFSQQQAAQAFLACDRNEQLAANFLFEGGDDMMDDYEGGQDDSNHPW